MGYRSQVVYAIEPEIDSEDKDVGLGKWRMFLAEARVKPETTYAMSMIDNTGLHVAKDNKYWKGGLDSENNSILIEMEDVKWYDSYQEVESFKSLVELAETEGYENHINLAYVRIGEEDGDLETYHVHEGYRLLTTWSSYDYADVSFEQTDEERRNVSTEPKQGEKVMSPVSRFTIEEIMKIWRECYGEDIAVEYEGFINKLKEREHE